MEVLLIKPYSKISNLVPPLGLGYLASALGQKGVSAKIIHCYKDGIDIPNITKFIREKSTKIVGVTCCSNDHFWLQNFARALESLPQVQLIAGGPHATGLSTRLMELIPRINFIIRSEGEHAFPELVGRILNGDLDDTALAGVPNLAWRDAANKPRENPVVLPPDLDSLAWPDWGQMDPREYSRFVPHGGFAQATPVAPLLATRGCPYSCRYCASYLMNGKKIRKRSPESVAEEITYLIKDYGVKEIHIEDDNFTFDRDYVIAICSAIRRKGIKLKFGLPNGVRADRLDKEVLEELRGTGFYFLSIGIESGAPSTLRAMNKQLDLDKVRQSVSWAKSYGFRVKGFFMLGYPGETKAAMLETVRFARAIELDQAFFSVYIPLPGTIEFERFEQEGKIDIHKCNWGDYYTGKFSQPPHVPEGMTADELRRLVSFAYRSFYFRPKVLLGMMASISSVAQIKHLLNRGVNLISQRYSQRPGS